MKRHLSKGRRRKEEEVLGEWLRLEDMLPRQLVEVEVEDRRHQQMVLMGDKLPQQMKGLEGKLVLVEDTWVQLLLWMEGRYYLPLALEEDTICRLLGRWAGLPDYLPLSEHNEQLHQCGIYFEVTGVSSGR